MVELPNGSALAVAKLLEHHPQLKMVELDRVVHSTALPNDPYLGSAWHLNKVGAPAAWDSAAGMGEGIKIAILDSGVESAHPDLAGNLIPGYNYVDWNNDTNDTCGHGTAVAGVAAAVTNNSASVAGMAGKAKIMPVKIASYNSSTGGCYAYYSTVANGIYFAADNGARVANLSYGGVAASQAILNAAQYFKSKGGLLFVSAGNNGRDEGATPTSSMVVVSATDENDNLAGWSSYGNFVTLSAPGTNIWTTSTGWRYRYGQWNGTSFSSPLAAGVAADMMSANSSLDNLAIESLLYSTSIDRGAAGRDPYFGYGRVNAAAAVQAAVARNIKADTQAPLAAMTSPRVGDTVSGLVAVDLSASDNVGVVRADLKVNGTVVATDTVAPFGFSWDSAGGANGLASLIVVAYDAAGNAGVSPALSVNVANAVKTATQTWVRCATEGNGCYFSGTRQVRYGANNSHSFKTAIGSILCGNGVFGDPAEGVTKTCDYAESTPVEVTPTPVVDTWTKCATEGGNCSFTGTRTVRYGANGLFAKGVFSGNASCNNGVFGDPAYGLTKTCEYGAPISNTPPPAPAPAPAPVVETWTDCATEGANCTFTGTRAVRYGAGGIYAKGVFNGATACTNGVFGDPVIGATKRCSYSSITQ